MTKFGSKLQTHWDWRAACNFMFGGTGSALVLMMAIFAAPRPAPLALGLLALALVGFGLFMVWLEIGRPWRFLHVFFHPQASWMTREAALGSVLFPVTFAGVVLNSAAVLAVAAVLGFAFLYCQARILKASRGIPAWREPTIVALIVSSGLVEGTAIAMMFFYGQDTSGAWMPALFLLLVVTRLWTWTAYRAALERSEAPGGTLLALAKLHPEFLVTGCLLPVLLVVIPVPEGGAPWGVLLAGSLALISGWRLKFGLVTKAAYKQGYGIGKLRAGRPVIKPPVRRKGDPVQL
ncbi:MAG TPA: phenylacetyl-CoA:acceptor oxidoreductase [Gammaproteobacteria bacterium]|nr:phenylacetyl-CoA:acceptor oxidoreductase [Gammaproteobacteria bacterium]